MSGPVSVRVFGVDLSLTRTGIAAPEGNAGVLKPVYGSKEPERRLRWVRDEVVTLARSHRAALVCMEGFSFGSKGRALDQIHGLGWLVRIALREASVPYVIVPPSVLKRYATGRGNADKAAMQMAAQKRLGYDTDRPDDNEVDALWLRALALDAYGCPAVTVPKAQRDGSIAAVTWPRIDAAHDEKARTA